MKVGNVAADSDRDGGAERPEGAEAPARRYSAPALEKGLDILELLSSEDTGLTQSEIARRLDRSVSEIFRMLVVLEERGYVRMDPLSDRYGLTTRLFEVAHRTPLVRRLTAVAGPRMTRLARETEQSVHMGVISDDALLVVGQVDSPANNVFAVRLGARIDLWRASSSRVIMAHMPQDAVEDLLARVPLPPGVGPDDMRRTLAQIRATGHEEHESFTVTGVINIAAPLIDHTGWAVAALTIPYLTRYDCTRSRAECRTALLAAAAEISRAIGGGAAPRPAQS